MRKLEIGVQSGNWYDETRPEESIRFIKSCGFEGIDYNICNLFDATFDPKERTSFFDQSMEELFAYYAPLKQAAKENDIGFSQLHGLFPMYDPDDEAKNAYLIAVTEKMMAICQYLECENIVVHPWTGPKLPKAEEREINLAIYRKLIPAAKQYGVTVCLENLFKHDNIRCFAGACTEAEEACWYIDTLNHEAGEELFGFCFDVGHANVTGQNIYQYITTLGKRIRILHIHDNDGTCDAHMLPYSQRDVTGTRTVINWDAFLLGLKEIGYEGSLAFEIFRGIDALPAEVRKEGLCLASAIGRYFRDQIEA